MARTALTVQQVSLDGIAISYTAAIADGHMFANDGNVLIHVKNTGGAPTTVTVQTPAKVGGLDLADVTVTVPATTGDRLIGPFDPSLFNQADGTVYVDYSVQAGVSIGVFRTKL